MKLRRYKFLILFALLLFPVFLYIFLKSSTENYYNIPIFHKNGINRKDCNPKTGAYKLEKYKLSENYYLQPSEDSIQVFVCIEKEALLKPLFNQSEKVSTNYIGRSKVKIEVLLNPDGYNTAEILEAEHYDNLKFKKTGLLEMQNLKNCYLLFPDETTMNIALVDRKGQLRGYYDGTSQEETDRLITEIDILLKNKE